MQIIKEFKTFAVKGNAIDLAVGVVIGAAFGRVVTSLVEDIINPLINIFTGSIDFSDKVLRISTPLSELVIRYGSFITVLINFIIVAFSIFLVIRQINKLKKKEEEQKKVEPKKSEEVVLLSEIKDLLARKDSNPSE